MRYYAEGRDGEHVAMQNLSRDTRLTIRSDITAHFSLSFSLTRVIFFQSLIIDKIDEKQKSRKHHKKNFVE